jgi:DNA-binding transcriptional MerR regulator
MKVVMGTSAEIGRTMRSAELARLAGVSTDALRHYERVGVLPAPQRTAGNYRVYPAIALDRVRLVRRALAFGFSLAELTSLRAQLKKVLRDWDGRLAKTSATERARLL